jgi:hypothetical protein
VAHEQLKHFHGLVGEVIDPAAGDRVLKVLSVDQTGGPVGGAASPSGGQTATALDASSNATTPGTPDVIAVAAEPLQVAPLVIDNRADADLFVLFAASGTPTANNANVTVPAGAYYECPVNYKGPIRFAFEVVGSGYAMLTRWT